MQHSSMNTSSMQGMEDKLRALLTTIYSTPTVPAASSSPDSAQMSADDFRMYVYKVSTRARAG